MSDVHFSPASSSCLDRRQFLAYFASIGLTSTLFPGVLWAEYQEQESGRFTKEMVQHAAEVAGLAPSDEHLDMMVQMLNGGFSSNEEMGAVFLDEQVEPPIYFSPAVAGNAYNSSDAPLRISPVETVSRPADLEGAAFWSIRQLAALIRSRQVSSRELTEMYLSRLERYDPQLECIVTLAEDLALAQADEADQEIAAGRLRGPLHGIPWGAKDLFATAGIPTQWGSPAYREQTFDYDAAVVTKLREAGAVLAGKLALGELAAGAEWFGGHTRCPWDTTRSAVGSSAGPAAATAAGMVGFSLGTETAGSIISPSSANGVVGLRPTFGRVSRRGAMPLTWTIDRVGPLCRYVEDCAVVFQEIMGSDPLDLSTVDAAFPFDYDSSIRGHKIGVVRSQFAGLANETSAMFDAALEVLADQGLVLEETELDPHPYSEVYGSIFLTETAAIFEPLWLKSERYKDMLTPQRAGGWVAGAMAPSMDYLRAQRVRVQIMQHAAQLFEEYAALVAPSLPFPAFPVGGFPEQASSFSFDLGLFGVLAGLPAVSVQCGFVENLPMGIQFVGAPYDEAGILRLAYAYEQATPWHERHPPMS